MNVGSFQKLLIAKISFKYDVQNGIKHLRLTKLLDRVYFMEQFLTRASS